MDPKGNKTKYVYNSQNRLKTVIDPQGKEIKYSYDLEARVIKETDRAGQDIHYQYNRDNNLTQKSIEGKNQDQYYLYNQIGRLQATISNNGIERYNYNKNGLITNKIMNNETVLIYKYNANSQIKSLTDIQGNIINYTYDSQARIKEVKDNTSTLATYNYTDNQLDAVTYNNGISINYDYNKDNQVTRITHEMDSNQILNTYDYTYDLNGNIIEKLENQQSTKYEYDQLYQLTKVNYPNDIEEKYTYDVSGNRQKRTSKESILDGQSSPIVKEITTNYQYNNLNQLTKSMENDIITTYLYDENGNMIKENNSKSGTIYYNYDAYNRLINVTKPDGQYQTNYYTVGNLRKAIEENGVYTGFTYNAGQVVSEHNSYGEIRQNIIRGYQQIATKDDTDQINYYLHNVHGDITSIVNSKGKMLNAYNYDAYGNITSKETLVPNRYNYAGEQYDNVTGQYYLRARYYNPTIGRFIKEDSFRGDGLNLYTYVQNNPINLIDPSGHCREKTNKYCETILNMSNQDVYFLTNMFYSNGFEDETDLDSYIEILDTLKNFDDNLGIYEKVDKLKQLGYPNDYATLIELSYRLSKSNASLAELDMHYRTKQQKTINLVLAMYGGIIAEGLMNGKEMSPLYSEDSALDQLEKNGFIPPGMKSSLSNTANQAISKTNTTRVGQWMSESEYNEFVNTGEIPRTNVLTKGKEGYMKQANKGDYYVEFDIDSSLLKTKDEQLGWSLVKSKNQMYLKLAEKKGEILPAPIGTDIEHIFTKPE